MMKIADKPKTFYVCDRRACEDGCNGECTHTSNIEHAENFEKGADGSWREKERDDGVTEYQVDVYYPECFSSEDLVSHVTSSYFRQSEKENGEDENEDI